MRRAAALAGFAVLLGAQAPLPPADTPAPEPTREEYCATVICRPGIHQMRLRAEDDGLYVVTTQPLPYVDGEGSIVLYAGEAIAVSFADRSDLSAPKFIRVLDHVDAGAADPVAAAAGAIILMLELKQMDGKPDMELILRNDTGVPLKFDTVMFVPARDGVHSEPASSCVVRPGMMNTHWPHPVAMLVLSHLRWGGEGEMSC